MISKVVWKILYFLMYSTFAILTAIILWAFYRIIFVKQK